jgi:hypothetical protein
MVTEIAKFTPLILLLLASCRSAPLPRSIPAADRKKLPSAGQIRIVEILGSPKNCGMIHRRLARVSEGSQDGTHRGCRESSIYHHQGRAKWPVKKWRFAPSRVDGSEPIEIKTESLVSFTLNQ